MLAQKRLLQDAASWVGIPHACSCLLSTLTAPQAVQKAREHENFTNSLAWLADEWHQKHVLEAKPALEKVGADKESKCWESGVCHCRRNEPLRLLTCKASKTLKSAFLKPVVSEGLDDGWVAVVGYGKKALADGDVQWSLRHEDRGGRGCLVEHRDPFGWRPQFCRALPSSTTPN